MASREARDLESVLARISADQAGARRRLEELLRIPSVSAAPDRAGDCRNAAIWVRDQLAGLGFQADIRETGGQPAVVAHHPGPSGETVAPRALFYSHYDVQPPDPIEDWRSAPFEPLVVDGPHGPRVHARGASDNKGQLVSWIEALRAFVEEAGAPPVPVSALVEGEEEIGSPNLSAFLDANAASLSADIVLANDASMWAIDRPALVCRLRGMLYTQIDLRAAAQDLHSGLYGGLAANPLRLLSHILADLHDEDMRVTLPGFYDGVEPPRADVAARWQALGFDISTYLGDVGLSDVAGEAGYSPLELVWARPTAELNGIWGGYSGEGSKTVIPAAAHAKLSFRLVPGQDPMTIATALRAFVGDRLPPDCTAKVTVLSASPATEIAESSSWIEAASRALAAEFGVAPVLSGSGGTLPVINALERALGVPALLYGWALNDDNPHSPNEKFELTLLEKGSRSHARLLQGLAEIALPVPR